MKKSLVRTLLVLGCMALIVTAPRAWARTYSLGLVEWVPWATAYVAQEQGFWKAEGLDMEIKQFANYDSEHLPAFEHGKTDFGIMMLGSAVDIISRNPGAQRIIYEHDWSHGGDLFILSKQIENVGGLQGKLVGVYTKSAPIAFFVEQVLAGGGLRGQDVKLVEISNTTHLNEAFRQGKFGAIVNYDPDASKVVNDGTGKLVATSADFPGVVPEGIAAQSKLLQEHPEVVKKFLRGWLKAMQWQTQPENRQAFFEIINRTMCQKSPYSETELEAFYNGAKTHADLADIEEQNQAGARGYVEKMLTFLKTTGAKLGSEKPEDYLDTRLALEQAKELFE